MKDKVISVDFKAEFGILKKPDINEGIYLTYNMLHKPALLGILGAIIGLEGYKEPEIMPQYFVDLRNLKTGIRPLQAEKGNFGKTVIQFNNAVGYASHEEGGNLIIKEQVLIKPSFRCYILINNDMNYSGKLDDYLSNQKAEYLPYLGKNDFALWWDNYHEYFFDSFQFEQDYKVGTIFMKSDQKLKEFIRKIPASPFGGVRENNYLVFEELPIGFDERLMQYEKRQFVYTNFSLPKSFKLDWLYQLEGQNELVQLF